MLKKLFIAPFALTIALSAVSPSFVQAEETSTISSTEAVAQVVNFGIMYNGASSSYKDMFGEATLQTIDNGQYKVTLEVPTMLTTFTVNGETPELVAQTADYNTYQFTTATLTDLPIYIEYDLGFYVGKHTMALTIYPN